MTEPSRASDVPPGHPAALESPPAPTNPPPAAEAEAPKPAGELSPEEQMERFAQELKEADWGHQPC